MKLLPVVALYTFTVVFCVLLVVFTASCSGVDCKDPKNASSASCKIKPIEEAALDCTGGSLAGAVGLWGPELRDLIDSARLPDGSINWGGIEGQLGADVYKYGSCVVGAIFNEYIAPPAIVSDAGSGLVRGARPHKIPPEAAKAEFERVRAHAMGGRKLTLPGGTL